MEIRDPAPSLASHFPGLQRHDAGLLWTDAGSREFIAEHYPWFLDTFDNYTYPIQRADVIRYFVLYHYGGIYVDLDIGCLKPMDPLLVYPVILPKTIPVGVSNDLMFSEKGHPMLEQTIHNLIKFDHSWVLNYPTVMFTTGPMFLSAQYGLYTASHPNSALQEVRILPKSLYGKNARENEAPHSFFSHFYGSSWHADDAAFIGFLGTWGKLLMWLGLFILVVGLVRLPSKQGRRFTRGYEIVFPRISRSGRWYFQLRRGSFSASGTSTQVHSPISSEAPSPIEEVPVLHLPFDSRPPSPSSDVSGYSDPYAGRVQSPLVEAFNRIRNRVSSYAGARQEPPDTPIRTGRQRSNRSVMFFLPAIFTQAPDIELQPAPPGRGVSRTISRPPVPRRSEPSSTFPPEKESQCEDIETGRRHDSGSGSRRDDEYTPLVDLAEDVPSHSSTSRPRTTPADPWGS
ncbi:Inositol phosphoceramide mannosyltransferase 3 [Psilocybe cubensis]|uniref:Inositol phosphoceramide mannosyltransferase 3 n=2 Tax=Psilocybe cubensis TaxID=181762 RepID=A0ACB8H514_PSICU|nr:Inositol phosphoceramide mannosyltransferase 3 [Psilocybe cubensis]KAH9482747.1 Inositol phosphoceramide mannosyltransferase 3 [Psilocybe cubensis]